MKYKPLTEKEEKTGRMIVDSAYTIHSRLGPGLLEQVYETCFCHELRKRGLNVRHQVAVPIVYDNVKFESALRLDVIVEDLVICELKTVEKAHPLFHAQLLSYLKLTHLRLGYLINFHVPLIRDGIKRIIL